MYKLDITYSWDDAEEGMPSTAAVVSNFKKVSKDMKRHTLSVFVDDPLDARADDNGYFTMPLF